VIAVMPQMRLLVAVEPVDFRKGIDGLAAVCRQRLQTDPMSGAVFVFGSRNRKSLKILVYDGQGFFLCQKRLSAGRFNWWPKGEEGPSLRLETHQLQLLLWNGDPAQASTAPLWRPLAPAAGC
jgi:transposase